MLLRRQDPTPSAPAVESSERPRSSRRRRVHPFFRDLSITLATQLAVAIGALLLYRLLAIKTGTDGFASYSLIKQGAAFFFPIVTVGLVAGLPRYIALPRDEKTPTTEAYLLGGLIIGGAATLLVGGVALVFLNATASLFFGDPDRDELVGPLVALTTATTLFYMSYGYFRGQLRLTAANGLQIAGPVALPSAIVLAFPDRSIATLVYLMALGIGALSLAVIVRPIVRAITQGARLRLEPAARALFDYGHRRVPGDLAQLGLLVLVPILTSHVGSLTDVAYVTAGLQVLAMLHLAVVPIGLVLLPTLTRMLAEDREVASGYVAQLSSFAAHVAIFVSFQVLLFADILIRIWLGQGFDDAGSVVRAIVAPAALYVLYLVLRSTLDAAEVRSYNSRNNLIAFAVFGACAGVLLGLDLMRPVMSVAWSFAAGVTTSGILAFTTVHRLFHVSRHEYALRVALPAGLAAGVIGLTARPLIDGSPIALLLLGVLELALAAGFVALLVRAGVAWPRTLAARFYRR
jgi:O-antigen/teichoic acid export membrane protein